MATPGRPLSDQERKRIIKLREFGKSIREVATAEMVSTRTVQKVLRSTK